jgi:hypothetical protein
MGILADTKKILGVASDYTAFDLDITTHINSAFSILMDLGVGPVNGYFITSDANQWSEFTVTPSQLALVRTYLYLKARMLFDPPTTSYMIEAMEKQIAEHEWRLNASGVV